MGGSDVVADSLWRVREGEEVDDSVGSGATTSSLVTCGTSILVLDVVVSIIDGRSLDSDASVVCAASD